MAFTHKHLTEKPSANQTLGQDLLRLGILALMGAGLAVVDAQLQLKTVLLEFIHALVVTTLFAACLVSQTQTPQIRQFGWGKMVLGTLLVMLGTWADILDNFHGLVLFGVPFGHTWQQAYIEKFLGYTMGFGLITFGCFQWVPWMITTRNNVEKLNKDLTQLLTTLDDHVDSERLNISRELHDDVAQRLTFLGYKAQLIRKQLDTDPALTAESLKEMQQDISDTLKSVRQISHNLRPEALYALGLVEALRQFVEKQHLQQPQTTFTFDFIHLPDLESGRALDSFFDERQLLHLFRVVQEGVRNAMKHSQATAIHTTIEETKTHFILTVTDNGKGLPWETLPPDDTLIAQGHLGLAGLQERVKELGGTFLLAAPTDKNHAPLPGCQMRITIEKVAGKTALA